MLDRAVQPSPLDRAAAAAGLRLPRLSRVAPAWLPVSLAALPPALVLAVDARLALLSFLTVPVLALATAGRARAVWCSLGLACCAASTLAVSVPPATTLLRLPLVIAVAALVLILANALQREAREAELRRRLTAEAHHRVKNSLQGVADLLYLARTEDDPGAGLVLAASRIRSIAAAHELLGRSDADDVAVDELLRRVAAGLDGEIRVEAEPLALPLERAQRVGIVANELLTNAARHGGAPIRLTLDDGESVQLTVEDGGARTDPGTPGIGLTLVRHVVEYGLGGTLELSSGERGTRARVAFPRTPCAS